MKGSKTLNKVQSLIEKRNVMPFFIDDKILKGSKYETEIEIITEMWDAGTQGTEHPNWETGNHEGFAILAFDKPSLIYRKGTIVEDRSFALHYVESDKKYITCPLLYFGPDTYTLVSCHRGQAGLIIKAVMDAMNHFAPGRWKRDKSTGNISVDGKHFFSWISDHFDTDLADYALEITTFCAHHDLELYQDAYRGDHAPLAEEVSGLTDLLPEIDLKDFFEYIYDNIERFL